MANEEHTSGRHCSGRDERSVFAVSVMILHRPCGLKTDTMVSTAVFDYLIALSPANHNDGDGWSVCVQVCGEASGLI